MTLYAVSVLDHYLRNDVVYVRAGSSFAARDTVQNQRPFARVLHVQRIGS